MLVLVVGSQREGGRCSSLLVNGDKKEGEKRAKKNPNQEGVFAPSARMSRRQMFDSVVVCCACDAIQWILDRRVELKGYLRFSSALIIRHYFQMVHF